MNTHRSEASGHSPTNEMSTAAGTVSLDNLQSRWHKFKPPIPVEEIIPKDMTLDPGTQGTFQSGDRDTSWSVNTKGERTARYTIKGTNGTAYGGVRHQRDFNGLPEALAWHVKENGEGFQWAQKLTNARELDKAADYGEVTRARALTKYNPNDVDAIHVGEDDGFSCQVVPVDYPDILRSLPVAPSDLPLRVKGEGYKELCNKDGMDMYYSNCEVGTNGTWIRGEESTGGWTHYPDKRSDGTVVPSLFVHDAPLVKGAKCAFGLETKSDGMLQSNGWFLPRSEM